MTPPDTEFISAWMFIQELSGSCLKDTLVPCKNELKENKGRPRPSRSNGSTTAVSPQLSTPNPVQSETKAHGLTRPPAHPNTLGPQEALPSVRVGQVSDHPGHHRWHFPLGPVTRIGLATPGLFGAIYQIS